MSHSQHSTVRPHVSTHSFPKGYEEGKKCKLKKGGGGFLLLPLCHLLTHSLDLAKLGLCGDLCDTFHRDAFKEYCTLGVKNTERKQVGH